MPTKLPVLLPPGSNDTGTMRSAAMMPTTISPTPPPPVRALIYLNQNLSPTQLARVSVH